TSKDCDWGRMASIYGQMANIFHNQYLPDEELKALRKCEYYDNLNKDTFAAIKSYELRMRPYYLLDNKDSVMAISKEAYRRYLKHGYLNEAASLLSPMIAILVERKQYDEAKKYLYIYENGTKSNAYSKPIIFNHDKGLLFIANNQIDSALCCFNRLLSAGKKEAAYHGLLTLYQKIHKPDSIAKYAKLFAEANDSSYIGKNSEVIAQMTAMYNYGHQEKIAKEKTIESANARTMTLIISSTASIILILLLITITLLRHRHNEKERIHKEQEKLLLKRYNETKTAIAKLEKEKEALIVDNANIDLLLHTINRFENEKTELEAKLRELNQITDDVDFMAWYESFIDCNAAKNLHTKTIIAPNKTVEIEDELWDELIKQIKRNCPAFLTILDSYSLTPTYYKIILLNTFDFTNGEISILLNKTNQQISNIHNRISKKIFPSCKETRKLKQNIQKILKEKRINL
ncbi:MAG: hypothetical protein MJ204_11010, partial [Bacteroidales bacterium]|nr:hypothetical protein [Bacteroidales bacterium]